jgi:hypothetical protein
MSTPVVDRQRGIVFVVARVLLDPDHVVYRLHAIDLHDGHDLAGSPTDVSGAALGVTFNPNYQNQRSVLALARGQIIIAFGSYADFLPYHGWIFSYRYDDGVGFTRSAIFVSTPDGSITALCAVPAPTPESIAADAAAAEAATRAAALGIQAAIEAATLNPAAAVTATLAANAAVEAEAAKLTADRINSKRFLNAANNCAHGGIWMGGRAPAVDSEGRVLVMVGNGHNDLAATSSRNFGNSLIALDPLTLAVIDFFTPANHLYLNAADLDLGGSGPMVVPGSNIALGGGKEGVMYVWNLNNLGHFSAAEPGVIQKFPAGPLKSHLDTGNDMPGGALIGGFAISDHAGHIMGGPVFWPRAASHGGSRLYNWSENSELRAYSVDPTATAPVSLLASGVDVQLGHPGGILTLSANGSTAGTGIIWAATYNAEGTWMVGYGWLGALNSVRPGILRAYAAEDLKPLWTNEMDARDKLWDFAKFTPPTVANGRVYVATFSNKVVLYGLFNHNYTRPSARIMKVIGPLLLDED